MVTRLVVNELAVEAARVALFDANRELTSRELRMPTVSVQTLGETGAELSAFVRGLDAACGLLGDSARAGSMQLSALLFATDELDRLACHVPNGSAYSSGSNGSDN